MIPNLLFCFTERLSVLKLIYVSYVCLMVETSREQLPSVWL